MLEKVETTKKQNRLVEILSSRKAKYIVGTVLLSGLGIILPRIFHILAGSSAGATFLPMHIAVLISALTFGLISSSIVAGSSVVFSYLLSILNKKFNSYISLIATIIIGRVLYARNIIYSS